MTKNIFLLFNIFIFNNLFSQQIKIEYEVKKANLSQKFILDLNNNNSLFYSNEFCGKENEEIFNYMVVEKRQEDAFFILHDQIEILNIKYNKNINLDWKLEKEEKIIDSIKLQKATLLYKDILWTAWYNKSISINAGPFIFNNLPGLIYEINSKDLNINLIGISKKNDNCYTIPKDEEIITEEKYFKNNDDLLKILKESYRKVTSGTNNDYMQELILNSIKKDLFREYL